MKVAGANAKEDIPLELAMEPKDGEIKLQ